MGDPELGSCGLSCDSSAGYKLHPACGIGRRPTLGRTLGFSQPCFSFGTGRSELSVRTEGRGGFIVFPVHSWTQTWWSRTELWVYLYSGHSDLKRTWLGLKAQSQVLGPFSFCWALQSLAVSNIDLFHSLSPDPQHSGI